MEELRRLAGKGSWAANLGPALRNFLQPLWRVIGDAERERMAPALSAKGKWAMKWQSKRGRRQDVRQVAEA